MLKYRQYPSSNWPSVGVWVNTDFFYLYDHSKSPETQNAFLTNQTTTHRTMLQTTYSLCDEDSSRLVEQFFQHKLPYKNADPLRVALELWLSFFGYNFSRSAINIAATLNKLQHSTTPVSLNQLWDLYVI